MQVLGKYEVYVKAGKGKKKGNFRVELITVNPWTTELLVGFTCLSLAPLCRCRIANERQFGILTPPAMGRMIPGMLHLRCCY